MKNMAILAVLVVALVTFLGSGIGLAGEHAVKVGKKEVIGNYLTDSKGMTLYMYKKDTPGKVACEGGCVDKWPLFFQEQVEAQDNLNPTLFGTIIRSDGRQQTTYKEMPLYYFGGDKTPGETIGQGMGGSWFVVAP